MIDADIRCVPLDCRVASARNIPFALGITRQLGLGDDGIRREDKTLLKMIKRKIGGRWRWLSRGHPEEPSTEAMKDAHGDSLAEKPVRDNKRTNKNAEDNG